MYMPGKPIEKKKYIEGGKKYSRKRFAVNPETRDGDE